MKLQIPEHDHHQGLAGITQAFGLMIFTWMAATGTGIFILDTGGESKLFEQWELSPSESEVAMLLIKGFSMKEIAELRNVKEKTVRLQATKIYSKSGYSGRHELAAHFIEDLMSEV